MVKSIDSGKELYKFIEDLFPICRSLTGKGTLTTLDIIKDKIPIKIESIASGSKVLDWEVPSVWDIEEAYIETLSGERVIDFKDSNLHVVNYSEPINKTVSIEELKSHVHTLPDYPDWIPYLTSYYKSYWGFCMSQKSLESMSESEYRVVINSKKGSGFLNYGELVIKGETSDEILISTYLCHPSMCNDNLSGVSLATYIAKHIQEKGNRYSYRFLFIPETIGAIVWLSRNEEILSNIKHGLVITCVGDSGVSTYKKTKQGHTELDKAVEKALIDSKSDYKIIDFFPTGSDERQFSSPGFNLPVGSLMRTPYGKFPEYHTSADNLSFVKKEMLYDSYEKYLSVLNILEKNIYFINTKNKGEPQLGKYGLYEMLGGQKGREIQQTAIYWLLNYSDGKHSLLDISILSGVDFKNLYSATKKLVEVGLLREKDEY